MITRPAVRTARLEELKIQGHAMIDRLVSMGVRKDSIYSRLRLQINRKDKRAGHFKYANTIQECELIIKKLNRMIIAREFRDRKANIENKQREFIQTLKEYQVGHSTLWERIKIFFHGFNW